MYIQVICLIKDMHPEYKNSIIRKSTTKYKTVSKEIGLNTHFPREDKDMANKYIKRCSIPCHTY